MTPSRLVCAAALLLMLAPAADASASRVLTLEGLGPVRIGMTLRQVERALGARLKIEYPEDYSCGGGSRADGRDPDIWYMIDDRRLARIEIVSRKGQPATVTTAQGLGVGSTEADILRVYGARVKTEPHPYLEGEGHYMKVDAPGHRRGILFETNHGVVTTFRAGTYPALGYIEGCL